MRDANYKKPKMTFMQTQMFESVAAECWANASLYCLVDPTDDDGCGGKNVNMQYADLADFTTTSSGCNKDMKDLVMNYLKTTYGPGTGDHYLTDADINTIMSSGGGNMGTSLKTSQYIIQVRS